MVTMQLNVQSPLDGNDSFSHLHHTKSISKMPCTMILDSDSKYVQGLVFDGFSSFCDEWNELGMTSITRNS